MPIRVLHAIETPGTGGAERVLVDIARSLTLPFESLGMTLVEGWTADQLRAHGIETHVMSLRRSFDLAWPFAFAKFLRRQRIDIVHCHEFTTTCYAALGCAIASVPLVSTMHGKNYWPERAYTRVALRSAARSAASFVVVSEDLKRFACEVLRLAPSVVRVVPNGIDLTTFKPNEQASVAVRASLGASSENVVIVCVGALEPVKAHAKLLEAMAILIRTTPHARLWLVGEGYLREDLERHVATLGLQNVVRFLGWRTDVHAILAAADISVLASRSEGMPLAIMESMACQRAVIATRVGGLPELIEDGISGLLVNADSSTQLAEAMHCLTIEPERRKALGTAASLRAAERFSLGSMKASYQWIYQNAVAQ
jgi:glycosyltransferase involved in cell wall biosynthesis